MGDVRNLYLPLNFVVNLQLLKKYFSKNEKKNYILHLNQKQIMCYPLFRINLYYNFPPLEKRRLARVGYSNFRSKLKTS